MKKIVLLLFSMLSAYTLYAQNYVLEVKGKVTQNNIPIKAGDELGNKQKLKFEPNTETRLLTPQGYYVVTSSNPKANTSELGGLLKEELISVRQKNLNTRGFDVTSDEEVVASLRPVLEILKADKQNIGYLMNRYVEPFLSTKYKKIDMARVENLLQDKFDLPIPTPGGCLRDENVYKSVPQTVRLVTRSYANLPASYSLKKYCPTPKSQSFSDCVGWSTTYGARTIMYAINSKITDAQKITDEAFAPSFTYGQIKLDPADVICSKGTYIQSALDILKKQGSPKYKDFTYECSPRITQDAISLANNYKIKDYKRLTSGYNADKNEVIDAIKKSISENKPVVIASDIYNSFLLRDPRGRRVIADVWDGQKGASMGGHAMTVIGYDNQKYGGAFEILNSWGTGWGNEGYIWVRYNDFVGSVNEAYELIDSEETRPKPNIAANDLSGSFKIVLDDGSEMPVQLAGGATRDFNVVRVEKSTYSVTKPYSSGTQFRISFTNNQPAYVYVIGYNSSSANVSSIFPFENFSAYLNYKQNEVAIPNEDYYIQMDNTVGTEYLCILYSKENLDIASIIQRMKRETGGFNTRLKSVLSDKLVDGSNIKFQTNKVSFEAMSKGKSIIPIVVEMKHTN